METNFYHTKIERHLLIKMLLMLGFRYKNSYICVVYCSILYFADYNYCYFDVNYSEFEKPFENYQILRRDNIKNLLIDLQTSFEKNNIKDKMYQKV